MNQRKRMKKSKIHIGHFVRVEKPYYTVFKHTELKLYCNRDPNTYSFVMRKAVNGDINKYCKVCRDRAFKTTSEKHNS